MGLSFWCRTAQQLFRCFSGSGRSRRPGCRVCHRPRLEVLEDRVLLTTRIWDGGAVVGDNWTEKNNWAGNLAPVAGDELIFPGGVGANDRTNTNDFPAGTTFNKITFTPSINEPYTLSGNRITLGPGGILSEFGAAGQIINFDISLSAGSNLFDIVVQQDGGDSLQLAVELRGVISGSGDVLKVGSGKLRFAGSSNNTYSGTTQVNQGRLILAKSTGVTAILGAVTIAAGASLNLIGSQTIGPLSLNGIVAGGTLILNSPGIVNLGSNTIIDSNLSLNGSTREFQNFFTSRIRGAISSGSLTKSGPGTLILEGTAANTYTGTTRINQGQLTLAKNLGVTAVAGPLIIGDGLGSSGADRVVLNAPNQIADTAAVTVSSSGLLDLGFNSDTIGPLTLNGGRVTTTTGILTLNGNVTSNSSTGPTSIEGSALGLGSATRTFFVADGAPAEDLRIAANVVGSGGLTKTGAGTLVLTKPSAYAGLTTLNRGTLLVNAMLQNSNVTVNDGFLGGTAFVGNLFVPGGTVSPGPGLGNTTGILTAKSATLNDTSTPTPTPSTLLIHLNGTIPGSGYDQLAITGTDPSNPFPVFPLGATLNVQVGFLSALGDTFKIIDNKSALAVHGSVFKDLQGNNLTQGATLTAAGQSFSISYVGGDGNDVVLTRNSGPAFQNRKVTSRIREGGIATLTGTITEPDAGDTFFLDVNWGDGSPPQTFTFPPGTPRDVAVTHRYLDDNPSVTPIDRHKINLLWRDQHGGSNTATLPIVVRNVAPRLSGLTFSSPVVQGQLATLSGLISDPGVRDTFKLKVVWGDRSKPETLNLPAGTTSFSLTHRFTRTGHRTVVLSLADDDKGKSSTTIHVPVNAQGAASRSVDGALGAIGELGAAWNPAAVDEFFGQYFQASVAAKNRRR